jgi:hypothetical protein
MLLPVENCAEIDTIFTSFTMHMVHNTLAVVLLILVGAV